MLLSKIPIILGILLIGSVLSSCQKESPSDFQKEQFIKTFGGAFENEAVDALLVNGNFYVLGNVLDKESNSTIFLTKTDAFGDRIWEKKFNQTGTSSKASQLLKFEKQAGIAIIGTIVMDDSANFSDIYLLVVDEMGEIINEKIYNDTLYETGKCITELTNGGLLIGGTIAANTTTNPHEMRFIRTDASGTIIGAPSPIEGTDVDITGICNNSTKDFIYVSGSNNGNSVIQLINADGSLYSQGVFKTVGQINGIVNNEQLNVFICGTKPNGTNGNDDVLVAKIAYYQENDKLLVEWQKEFGFAGADQGYGIGITLENHIILTGSSQNTDLNTTDVYLVETDELGNQIKSTVFGGSGNEKGVKSIESEEAKIVTLSTANYGTNNMITFFKLTWN